MISNAIANGGNTVPKVNNNATNVNSDTKYSYISSILINGDTTLLVVDVITFTGDKISSVKAYKG